MIGLSGFSPVPSTTTCSELSVAIIPFSIRGEPLARRLAQDLGGTVVLPEGAPGKLFRHLWGRYQAFLGIGAAAILIRSAAPLLEDKGKDPCLLCIPEDGEMVLPLLGSHLGGGADLARRCAALLGVPLISTTATDRAGLLAPDLLARRWGCILEGREHLAAVNGLLLDQGTLAVWQDIGIDLPFPAGYASASCPEEASVVVSARSLGDGPRPQVRLVPPELVAGVGCRRGIPAAIICRAIRDTLSEGGWHVRALAELRTADVRAQEPGIQEAARILNLPLRICSRSELKAEAPMCSPSPASRYFQIPGVAEPCAAVGSKLLGPRMKRDGVTVALGHRPFRVRGFLAVVGTGPGDARFLTGEAHAVLENVDVLLGYHRYVDQLPGIYLRGRSVERYTMGEEEHRVRRGLDLARRGHRVALLSGGDPILFGMAGLAISLAEEQDDLRVIPGISAAQVAGVALGAPYSNGLVCLSLSDYLQPWEEVLKALRGAAASGLATALYNPVRRDLAIKLTAVREVFRHVPEAVLVRHAGRKEEDVRVVPLEALSCDVVDMGTLIFLPGTASYRRGPWWLDRRGYTGEGIPSP